MNKQISNLLENNWDNLKNKIQTQWEKISDNDLEQISGSYDRLITKLKKAYALKSGAIEDEVLEFFVNNDLIEKTSEKSKTVDLPSIKEAISDHLEDYVQFIKTKSQRIETTTKKNVQENPIKWLGMAAFSGFVLAKFIRF